MVYVNLFSTTSSMGAGWEAFKDATTGSIVRYDLVHCYSPSTNKNHNLYTTMNSSVGFQAKVEQKTSSTNNCWVGTTFSNSQEICFATGSHPAGMAGNIDRTFNQYSANTNDMPGLFDSLQYGYWSGASKSYKYFSDHTNLYKCWTSNTPSTSRYRLDQISKLSTDPIGQPIDKVGVGPRTYTADDCSSGAESPAWTLIGE